MFGGYERECKTLQEYQDMLEDDYFSDIVDIEESEVELEESTVERILISKLLKKLNEDTQKTVEPSNFDDDDNDMPF